VTTGINMITEVQKILDLRKSRKRPIDMVLPVPQTPTHDRIVKPRISAKTPSQVPLAVKIESTLEVIDVDGRNDSDSDSLPSSIISNLFSGGKFGPCKSATTSGSGSRLKKPAKKAQRAVVESKSRGHNFINLNDNFIDEHSDHEEPVETLVTKASSGHAAWPLKFVKSMAEGFALMDTMDRSVASRFTSCFGVAYPGSKATWNLHSNIWEVAPSDLKDRYIDAGYTNAGLWKDFKWEVEQLHGGKVPGK
jgi:hypothetical protein